jgi:hypothetical protein
MKVFVVVYGRQYEPGGTVDSVYTDKDKAEKRAHDLEYEDIFDADGDEIIAEWVEVTEVEVK